MTAASCVDLVYEPIADETLCAVVTLNRPRVKNAIDHAMIGALNLAFDEIQTRANVRAVIFTGAQNTFASGADIQELKERGVSEALLRINAAFFSRVETCPLPTIAAVEGFALGGGCELMLACDIRVAASDAKFGQPEVGLGIIPGAGAIERLWRLVGIGRAKELILTGRIIDAAEAERIGLVEHVVHPKETLNAARAIARELASRGALAVRLAKAALNAAVGATSAPETLDAIAQAVLFESEEKHDRMAAFLKRRAAKKEP